MDSEPDHISSCNFHSVTVSNVCTMLLSALVKAAAMVKSDSDENTK
jgi:hypothetical protein